MAGIPGTRLRINTGEIRSHSGSLDLALCDRLAPSGKWQALVENRRQVGDKVPEVKEGRLESLKIGPFLHCGLCFGPAPEPGTLGLSFLRRYTVTFDFPAGVLYLRPSSRHSSPDQLPCSGLHVLRRSGTTVVNSIDEDSPADRGGIHPGDEIMSINGTQCGTDGFAVFNQLLKGVGRTVHVVIRRDGELREVPLSLDSSWHFEKPGR